MYVEGRRSRSVGSLHCWRLESLLHPLQLASCRYGLIRTPAAANASFNYFVFGYDRSGDAHGLLRAFLS